MHHSKSLSFLYKKATGKELPDALLADLGKFANLLRDEVIKDCAAAKSVAAAPEQKP